MRGFYDCAECLASSAVQCAPCDPEPSAADEEEAESRRPAYAPESSSEGESEGEGEAEGESEGDGEREVAIGAAVEGKVGGKAPRVNANVASELDEALALEDAHESAQAQVSEAVATASEAQKDLAHAHARVRVRVLRSGATMEDEVAKNAMRLKEACALAAEQERLRRVAEATLLQHEAMAVRSSSGPAMAASGVNLPAQWVAPSGAALQRSVRSTTRERQITFSEAVMRAQMLHRPEPPQETPPQEAGARSERLQAGAKRTDVDQALASAQGGVKRPVPASAQGAQVAAGRAGGRGRGRGAGRGRAGKGPMARAAAPSRRSWAVLRLRERRPSPLGGFEYLVEWAGYPAEQSTWEPACNIAPDLVEGFDPTVDVARSTASLAASTARADQPSRELTAAERDLLLDSRCPVPKQWQSNTPNGGFFSRTWGVLVFNRSCVQVVDFTELFGSESMSQVVFALLKLFHACPGLLEQLKCIAYDDACHLLKFLELRRDVPQYDEIVRRNETGKLVIFVDVAHFDVAHQESDVFCRQRTNPHLKHIEAARKDQNSEASEQSNAWLSRCKLMVRQMSPSRYRAFLLILFWRRNERIIVEFATTCTVAQLRSQAVAHGLVRSGEPAARRPVADLRKDLCARLRPVVPAVRASPHAWVVAASGFWEACT